MIKKMETKNMKEKLYKQQTSYDLYLSDNVSHPVTKTFTKLHYTSPNHTLLHFTIPVVTSFPLI